MKKITFNILINCLALISFLFLTSTGFLLNYTLPAGQGKNSIWGLTRHEWGGLHFYIAIVLVLVLAIHLVLHWPWIKAVVIGKSSLFKNIRTIIITFCFILLVGLAVSPFFAKVDSSTNFKQDRRGEAKH